MAPENPSKPTPAQPIILTAGKTTESKLTSKKSFFSTFGILLAGWFFGNLIILSLISLVLIVLVGSSGLVKVPFLSNFLFGTPAKSQTQLQIEPLTTAEKKLKQIESISNGRSISSIVFYEDEANALLTDQFSKGQTFPVINQKIRFLENEFVFSGNLAETNAPVEIIGRIEVEGLTANITVVSAKFGKLDLPDFIATNIIDSNLSKIGLSLGESKVPAKSVEIQNGILKLHEVVKP